MQKNEFNIANRFRNFLPIVIDVETGGFNAEKDAILEIAAITIKMNEKNGLIEPDQTYHYHIEPFEGANIEPSSLEFTGIKPYHPFRFAIPEEKALNDLFSYIRKEVKEKNCQRGVLVGHNPFFDLSFIQAAVKRHKIKRIPLHSFTTFDTATLSAAAFGQTVLAKAVQCAGIEFDHEKAHSALYDTEVTAQLFCYIINHCCVAVKPNDEKESKPTDQ